MARLTGDDLAAFVAASCDRSGVPVKVTDRGAIGQVAVLLGRGGSPALRGTARPSDSPGQIDPAGIESVAALLDGGDGGAIEDGFDDGVLPGQVQPGPFAA